MLEGSGIPLSAAGSYNTSYICRNSDTISSVMNKRYTHANVQTIPADFAISVIFSIPQLAQ